MHQVRAAVISNEKIVKESRGPYSSWGRKDGWIVPLRRSTERRVGRPRWQDDDGDGRTDSAVGEAL